MINVSGVDGIVNMIMDVMMDRIESYNGWNGGWN
jgi:hypothetical protein